MLTDAWGPLVLAAAGSPVGPTELWGAWSADPVVVGGLLAAGGMYSNGLRSLRRRPPGWRQGAFWTGLAAVAMAVLSPVEGAATALVSAHMVQHVLLVLIAAPLLAAAAPVAVLIHGVPVRARRAMLRLRTAAGVRTPRTRLVWGPAAAWLLATGVLWLWHARVLYEAAVRSEIIHVIEHTTMLAAGLLLWGVVWGAQGARRVDRGQALLVVFAAGLQGILLSALLTFSRTPWYGTYADSAALWGLTAVADQQLAGVVLWAVGGVVHLTAALVLLGAWLREGEGSPAAAVPVGQPGPDGPAV